MDSDLIEFDFSDEIINDFKARKQIPIDFYNNKGQILIYRKDEATDAEIERLFKFINQGIYYKEEDEHKLKGKKKKEKPRKTPEGLSDTKLISKNYADALTNDTTEVFEKLRQSSGHTLASKKMKERMDSLFIDFSHQDDALSGLVNILELMQDHDSSYDVEKAIKRTIVSMAIKTRGMIMSGNSNMAGDLKDGINNLMMSSLFCDVGYYKMSMPINIGLSQEEMTYIKNHPLVSYLMIAHDKNISSVTKHNILMHHRPKGGEGQHHNDYPDTASLEQKLTAVREKYQNEPSKEGVVADINRQLQMIARNASSYQEDSNILALSSEFASLTSPTTWRESIAGDLAVKMILNNSFFTYSFRIMREFLDYIVLSLIDNQFALKVGDFVVVNSSAEKSNSSFELCQVDEVGRYQSRPRVVRIGAVRPKVETQPKLKFEGFDLENTKKDPRKARYDLKLDESRQLVYAYDPRLNETDFGVLDTLRP